VNNVNGWLIAWGLAMSLVALVASLIAVLRTRDALTQLSKALTRANGLEVDYQNIKDQRDRLNRENEQLHKAIGAQAKQNLDLHKANTKLREDLTEAQATVQLLRMPSDHATAPLEEVTPLSYADAKPAIDKAAQTTKRGRRGKITG
jgi:biopolymer transport protein ExbB/TolQ